MFNKLITFILAGSLLFATPTYASASVKQNNIIKTAKTQLGVPYRWGGTTSRGFDCSGFVNYVFKKNGIALPRTAASMYKKGKKISKSNLKKGDLVFFQTYKKGVSHVGIYRGNGKFIHASSSKGISIDKLNSNYWKNKFYGAKRVF